jgi:hypothetical protein
MPVAIEPSPSIEHPLRIRVSSQSRSRASAGARLAAIIAALLCASSASADEVRVKVAVTDQYEAAISRPAEWTHALAPVAPGTPPTVRMAPADQTVILLTTYLVLPKDGVPALEPMVIEMNARSAAASVEKVCRPKELEHSEHDAAYCEFTDQNLVAAATLAPGQFRYVASGMVETGEVWVNFTVLTNDRDSPDYRAALAAVGSIDVDER